MSIVPRSANLTKSVAGILNAIRYGIGGDYEAGVPEAQDTTASIRAVGEAILAYQSRQNAFVNALVNRITFEVIKSKQYQNPWAMFKRGMLEYGETVEEIFVNLCTVRGFSPKDAPSRVFQRNIPSVSTAFHSMNVQAEYPITISEEQLRQAFLSINGVTSLIAGMVDSVYSAMNYDEFMLMKYLIARLALDGKLNTEVIDTPSSSTAQGIVTKIKALSNNFEFMTDKYTIAGNKNFAMKDNQYVLESTDLNAIIDVNVLASSFHMEKAEFMGHVVTFDDMSDIDTDRLGKLLANDSTYSEFNATELGYLKKIRAIVCAKDFFMIYDNLQKMTEQYNGTGLYWNYFLHKWQTLSASPFENVVLLTDQSSTVSAIDIDQSNTTISAVGQTRFTATVTTVGFASKEVEWTLTAGTGTLNDKISVDQYGIVTVKTGATNGTYTLKATALGDGSTNDTIIITVSL